MKKDIEQLNRDLNFEFGDLAEGGLDLRGTNINEFYDWRFQQFQFNNSELSLLEKLAGWGADPKTKNTVSIKADLSERTFIQHELILMETYLKEPIRPILREKISLWVDYLHEREKAITIVKPPVPEWTQPLLALYHCYIGVALTEKNREIIEVNFKVSTSPELIRHYNKYIKPQNRNYSNFSEDDRREATAQYSRLLDLKTIMEDRSETGSSAFESLLSDIETLKKNLGYK